MNIVCATLEQVLEFRDKRCEMQQEMLETYAVPIVSFTMNIAGPYKKTRLIEFAFNETIKQIIAGFGKPLAYREVRCAAGCEALFAYDIEAEVLKRTAVEIEEALPVGRLLDLDIIGTDGLKLSRASERKCLICGGPVGPCARSRAHSLNEIEAKTKEILADYMQTRISMLAVQALLDELRLTPKPGLIDRNNNGAHRDMDIALMEKSAHTLGPYFEKAAKLGFVDQGNCAAPLQQAGICAEKDMFAATGGVNTHKGAIFSLGLLCAAAGEYFADCGEDIPQNAALLAEKLRPSTTPSHGAAMRKKYSAGGARAEALKGFPNVKLALEILNGGGSAHTALLTLLSTVEDSNLLWRGGKSGLDFVREQSADILTLPEGKRAARIKQLDDACIKRNLSPGGSADLLANALFLHALSNHSGKKMP